MAVRDDGFGGFSVGPSVHYEVSPTTQEVKLMHLNEIVRASDVSFNEGVLRLAAIHGRVAEFRYAKSDTAPIEHRSFVPESVYTTRKGDVVVNGPDEDRDGAYRSYRLDRIKGEVSIP